jgi:hypothetical protein
VEVGIQIGRRIESLIPDVSTRRGIGSDLRKKKGIGERLARREVGGGHISFRVGIMFTIQDIPSSPLSPVYI